MRDMWRYGDTVDRVLLVSMALLGLAVLAFLAALPWLIRSDNRERAALMDQGCYVADTHTRIVMLPIRIGNTTTLHPQPHTVETWRCPDGSEFER